MRVTRGSAVITVSLTDHLRSWVKWWVMPNTINTRIVFGYTKETRPLNYVCAGYQGFFILHLDAGN